MLSAFLTACPWDLTTEGVEPVLDRMRGEIGVTGLSLWVGTPPQTRLSAHRVEPRVFTTRGGLFFQPADGAYVATRCKPIVAEWLDGRNPLATIAEACAERQMELRAIVSATGTGRLAGRYPDLACRNAFGVGSSLHVCLGNPDVQAYLVALTADLSANYTLGGLSFADFSSAWYEAAGQELLFARPLSELERYLLSVCFCESCQQNASGAGIDVATAQRSVRSALEKSLEAPVPTGGSLDAFLADNEPLAAYFRWQTTERSSLLERLKNACRCELILTVDFDCLKRAELEELNLGILDAVVTRLDEPGRLPEALLPGARRSELGIPASFALGERGTELVALLNRAVDLGFSGAEIADYGLLTEGALTSIKRAIRFARRTAGD